MKRLLTLDKRKSRIQFMLDSMTSELANVTYEIPVEAYELRLAAYLVNPPDDIIYSYDEPLAIAS